MAGITTSPQFRESPETAKDQVLLFASAVRPLAPELFDCAANRKGTTDKQTSSPQSETRLTTAASDVTFPIPDSAEHRAKYEFSKNQGKLLEGDD